MADARRRYLYTLGLLFAVVTQLALAIAPHDRADWALENALVLAFGAALLITRRWFVFSRVSYTLIFLYLCLHAIGAHYTYSLVPYDEWWRALTGHGFNAMVGWERNNFDRVVHFSYGLLLAYPIREIFLRVVEVRGFWAYFLPMDVTLSTSALYELLEWGAAATVGGDLGAAYLGTGRYLGRAERHGAGGRRAVIAMARHGAGQLARPAGPGARLGRQPQAPASAAVIARAVARAGSAAWAMRRRNRPAMVAAASDSGVPRSVMMPMPATGMGTSGRTRLASSPYGCTSSMPAGQRMSASLRVIRFHITPNVSQSITRSGACRPLARRPRRKASVWLPAEALSSHSQPSRSSQRVAPARGWPRRQAIMNSSGRRTSNSNSESPLLSAMRDATAKSSVPLRSAGCTAGSRPSETLILAAGMLRREIALLQHFGQHAQHHHGRHAHGHPRLRATEQLADVLAGQRQLRLGQPRAHRQVFAAFGEGDALGAAGRQRRLQLGLQFLDGLRYGGLAQVQAARRGPDAAQFGHLQPGAEMMVLHTAPETTFGCHLNK